MQVEITAKANRHNHSQVAAAMAGLAELFDEFAEAKTEAAVWEQVGRINGYCAALVNMDVMTEETANTKVREAAFKKANYRIMELLHPDLLKEEGAQEDGN